MQRQRSATLPKVCGIYSITNLRNGKVYIGQSVDILRRWTQHLETAKKGTDLSLIHKAIRKYGISAFKFDILCQCPAYMLTQTERYYILALGTLSKHTPGGYNVTLPDSTNTLQHLTPQDTYNIVYYLLYTTYTIKEIASGFNVPESKINAINTGRTGKMDGYIYPLRNKHSKNITAYY